MSARPALGAILACALVEANCAKYQPRVLDPVQSEASFRARKLDDATLSDPGRKIDLATLTRLAVSNSAELNVARAKVAEAEAHVVTARQRPNPTLSADGGYNRTPESVATYSVSPAFVIETAGKRGFRTLAAQKLLEGARIDLYATEWQLRSRVRNAAWNYEVARRHLALLHAEREIRQEVTHIFEKRVALGQASNPELNAARADEAALSVTIRSTESEASQAIESLANAAGLPVSALEARTFDFAVFADPPAPESLPLLKVEKAGLLHRTDIRRALTEYEAADARLRLELANQYPNITLSPSYTFQEGFPAYTLGALVDSLPVFHRSQGPVAEAVAARHTVETQFLALQARAIDETELTFRQYQGALREWLAAKDSVSAVQKQRETAVVASFRAGESDRLDLAQAHLLTLAAERTQLDALSRAQIALGALQDAIQSSISQEPVR